MKKRLILVALIAIIIAMQPASVNAEELWSDPDYTYFNTIDYHQYYVSGPLINVYLGFMAYEINIEYLENSDSTYDYYAIYVIETINPSYAQGNWWAPSYIESAWTQINFLNSHQMLVDSLPDRSDATVQWQASVGVNGDGVGFSATMQYALPDVIITKDPDTHWGGDVSWNLDMTWGAIGAAHVFRATIIVRTYEGEAVNVRISFHTDWKFRVFYGPYNMVSKSDYVSTYFDGTPNSGGGGGGGGRIIR